MSLEMSPCHLESASGPHLINSELGTYPPDPLPLLREGGRIERGAKPLLDALKLLTQSQDNNKGRGNYGCREGGRPS